MARGRKLAVLVGTQTPIVSSMESSLAGSVVDEPRYGTAYGVLNGVNGAGDLASSVNAGLLWMSSPGAAMGGGAVLSGIASAILWAWLVPSLRSSDAQT